MSAPDRIYAAPPHDDPEWESGSGEWDVSDGWAVDGLTEYVNVSLYNELLAQRDAAVAAFVNGRHDLWMKTNIHVAVLLEREADRETRASMAAGVKGKTHLADMHGYTARAFRREAKTLRGQLAKKKVPLNFLE